MNLNKHFAVIDLETLGKTENSCILSLGLTISEYEESDITFQELLDKGLHVKFDLKEQLARGRATQKSTIQWWYEQSTEAKKILNPSAQDVSLYSINDILTEFFEKKGINPKKVDIYDRNSFDINKIQYVYEEDLDLKIIWDYHATFELSTFCRVLGYDRYAGVRVSDIPGAVYHNALHDSAVDHLRVMKVLHTVATN